MTATVIQKRNNTMHSNRKQLVILGLIVASCTGNPQSPSRVSLTSSAGGGEEGIVGASENGCETQGGVLPDTIVGTGALRIERLRMDRQTSTGASFLRQYACSGPTYAMRPGETIELWAEWRTLDNPRLRVNWGEGEPNSPEFIPCGRCLLTHPYPIPGLYRVVVTLDDRNNPSTVVTRTFFLDSRPGVIAPAPSATPTPTPTPTPSCCNFAGATGNQNDSCCP